jgi:lactate dehydrogenase-like 2-hydroxyacid dehydrogenase
MGFDMKVLYASRTRALESIEQEFRASYVDKYTLLRESDIVTLHLPLFPETRHYIGARELARAARRPRFWSTRRADRSSTRRRS